MTPATLKNEVAVADEQAAVVDFPVTTETLKSRSSMANATEQHPIKQDDAPQSKAAGEPPAKRNYTAPAELPTQDGPHGLRFDFNDGCRVTVPEEGGPWRVRLLDLDTGNIVYETEMRTSRINSMKRYYIRFRIEAWHGGERVLAHDYDAGGKNILIQLPVGTLGDSIGWLPYAAKFQHLHHCKLTVSIAACLKPLFAEAYPEIDFVTQEEVQPKDYYATYNVGLFFDDDARVFQPADFRMVGLHRTAAYILGVDPTEERPRLVIPATGRPIKERYVCIAAQSSTQSKYWNNPSGWGEVVGFLKSSGYRVFCIDQKKIHGTGLVWNHIPYGAEDMTGDRSLSERALWLHHADFFVGLSSGLSWLAWAAGTPVVMISGFTHPINEFATPYRIVNYHACNSCWNDVRVKFDHKDFLWCPRHGDTPRQFECSRLITAEHVKSVIKKIPTFMSGTADQNL